MYKKDSLSWIKHTDFIIIDILCLNFCYVLACLLWQGMNPFGSRLYRTVIFVLTLTDFFIAVLSATFKNVLKRGIYVEFTQTVKHTMVLLSIGLFFLFFIKVSAKFSRIVYFSTFFYYVFITFLVRLALKKYVMKHKNEDALHLFIITNHDVCDEVIDKVKRNSFSKYSICGVAVIDQDMTGEIREGVEITANADDVAGIVGQNWVDEVLIVTPRTAPIDSELLNELLETGVTVHLNLLPFSKVDGKKQIVEKIASYPVLTLTINYASTLQLCIKRCMDILSGIVGCLATVIIFIFVAPCIFIASPGPIFFSQTRVGQNGKQFKMYKFRSMYLDAEERKKDLMDQNKVSDGRMFKMDFDPRIIGNKILPDGTHKTGIGEFIRKTSLDEFPQFFNVLKGDMSLVGTRPPTVDETKLYDLHHYARLAIKPGITGMWQISGRSDITDFEEVVRLDKEYIENWNPGLDIKILLKTFGVVLNKKGSM